MIAPTFVLYLNLWGTSAKLLGDNALTGVPAESTSELFPQQALRDCQIHFAQTLLRLGQNSNIEVYPVGDFAYAFSSDLPKLVALAAELFQAMVFPTVSGGDFGSQLSIWPVRGAIARGVERYSEDHPALPLPWFGAGLTKAAELEKSAQKGMRLMIEKFGEAPSVEYPVRTIAIRGYEHFEVNWLPVRQPLSASDQSISEKLPELARKLMDLETNYSQQLSSSLSGLLRWSAEWPKNHSADKQNDKQN